MPVVIRRMWLAAQLLLATAVVTPVAAQSSGSGSLAITAQVVCPLTVVVSHPLDFGKLLAATSKTIAPNSATSGHFEIIASGGSAVTITLSMPSQLNPPAGTNLPITAWSYVASSTAGLGGTPVAFNSGTSGPINVSMDAFDGSTKMYFGIGATVTASAAQSTTTYTGTGQITAAYADL